MRARPRLRPRRKKENKKNPEHFEVSILSVALTRKKRGLLGSSDLEMRVEWLMSF